jgi:hypothetical protein
MKTFLWVVVGLEMTEQYINSMEQDEEKIILNKQI